MVMATQMLPLGPPVGNRSAVLHILARQNAVEAIKGRLQAQGIRLTNVPFRTIRVFADAYLEEHRQELVELAMEMVSKSPELSKMYEREQRQLRAARP